MTATPYGMRALTGELDKLTRAVTGNRNITLNEVWFKLSQLIEAGHIDKADAAQRVYQVAAQIGLPDAEIRATMASAGRAGGGKPRPEVPQPRTAAAPAGGGYTFDQPGDSAPSTEAPAPAAGLADAFWDARPALAHLRDAAHSRGRSAEAVLGVALARVAADSPHTLKLPPVVGARCGLSLIVALTGPPGTGKSSSKSIAVEMLPRRTLTAACDDVPPGSGEGLIEIMFEWQQEETAEGDKRKVKRQTRHNVFTYADEGELLAMQARRNTTSTILPIIRSVFTDATLGQANASEDRKRQVPGGNYVYGIVLGIQPDKAAALFDDAGGGTPQRFLWMPTDTPVPPPGARPGWPGDLGDKRKTIPSVGQYAQPAQGGWIILEVPTFIADEIEAADHQRQQHGCDPLDQHADLVRLKVAGILATMDGRVELDLEDWQLAEVIRDLSRATRDRAIAQITAQRAAENVTRGKAEGDRAIIVEDKQADKTVQRVGRWIVAKLDALEGGQTAASDLRSRLASRDRAYFGEAVDRLEEAGMIEIGGVLSEDAKLRSKKQ